MMFKKLKNIAALFSILSLLVQPIDAKNTIKNKNNSNNIKITSSSPFKDADSNEIYLNSVKNIVAEGMNYFGRKTKIEDSLLEDLFSQEFLTI